VAEHVRHLQPLVGHEPGVRRARDPVWLARARRVLPADWP
jgi:hypothetical protein